MKKSDKIKITISGDDALAAFMRTPPPTCEVKEAMAQKVNAIREEEEGRTPSEINKHKQALERAIMRLHDHTRKHRC